MLLPVKDGKGVESNQASVIRQWQGICLWFQRDETTKEGEEEQEEWGRDKGKVRGKRAEKEI